MRGFKITIFGIKTVSLDVSVGKGFMFFFFIQFKCVCVPISTLTLSVIVYFLGARIACLAGVNGEGEGGQEHERKRVSEG